MVLAWYSPFNSTGLPVSIGYKESYSTSTTLRATKAALYCSHHLCSLCECMPSDLEGDTGLRACSTSYRTRDWHKTKSTKFWSSPGWPGFSWFCKLWEGGQDTKKWPKPWVSPWSDPFLSLVQPTDRSWTPGRDPLKTCKNGAAALMWGMRLCKVWSDWCHSLR